MKKQITRGWYKRATTYIIPVIATLFICMIFCVAAWNTAKKESGESKVKTAQYFAQNLETHLKSVKSYAYEILNSQNMVNLSRAYTSGAEEEQVKIEVSLMSSIFQYCSTIKLAENILVYYPEQDRIISKYGALTAYQYFLVNNEELLRHPEMYQTRFDSVFDRKHGDFFTVVNPFNGMSECYYFACVPNNSTLENCTWALALQISPSALSEAMGEMSEIMNIRFAAMTTPDGNVFTYTDYDAKGNLGFTEAQMLEQLEGEDYVKSRTSLWNMDLFLVYDDTVTYDYLETLSHIMSIGLALAMLLGLVLALLSHGAREKQLSSVVSQLGGAKGTSLDKVVADFLEHTYQENIHSIRIIDRQRSLVRYSFFKELLRTGNLDENKLEHFCTAYDCNFENDGFSIFAVTCDKTDTAHDKDEIFDFLSAGYSPEYLVFWTRIENIDVFLCNYNISKDSHSLMENFRDQLQQRFSGHCYGSGVLFEDVLSCIREFRQIYQVITGRKFVAHGISVNKGQSVYQRLAEAIYNEDAEQQQKVFTQVCQQIQQEEDSNQNLSKRYALLYDLYNLPQLQDKRYILDEMFRDMRSQTWVRCLLNLLPQQEENDNTSEQTQKRVAAEVVRIISDEYDNPQMSLSILSERLGVSQSYLSRVFKQEYGENISHYLSKTRVEQAKQLMCNGDENLNTIALKVGFLSDMNLIRVFKKLENETPGNYRKKARG